MRGMNSDEDLMRLATQAGADLLDAERRLVTAESCTGGWVAKLLTDIAGSSAWYDGGVVAYISCHRPYPFRIRRTIPTASAS